MAGYLSENLFRFRHERESAQPHDEPLCSPFCIIDLSAHWPLVPLGRKIFIILSATPLGRRLVSPLPFLPTCYHVLSSCL